MSHLLLNREIFELFMKFDDTDNMDEYEPEVFDCSEYEIQCLINKNYLNLITQDNIYNILKLCEYYQYKYLDNLIEHIQNEYFKNEININKEKLNNCELYNLILDNECIINKKCLCAPDAVYHISCFNYLFDSNICLNFKQIDNLLLFIILNNNYKLLKYIHINRPMLFAHFNPETYKEFDKNLHELYLTNTNECNYYNFLIIYSIHHTNNILIIELLETIFGKYLSIERQIYSNDIHLYYACIRNKDIFIEYYLNKCSSVPNLSIKQLIDNKNIKYLEKAIIKRKSIISSNMMNKIIRSAYYSFNSDIMRLVLNNYTIINDVYDSMISDLIDNKHTIEQKQETWKMLYMCLFEFNINYINVNIYEFLHLDNFELFKKLLDTKKLTYKDRYKIITYGNIQMFNYVLDNYKIKPALCITHIIDSNRYVDDKLKLLMQYLKHNNIENWKIDIYHIRKLMQSYEYKKSNIMIQVIDNYMKYTVESKHKNIKNKIKNKSELLFSSELFKLVIRYCNWYVIEYLHSIKYKFSDNDLISMTKIIARNTFESYMSNTETHTNMTKLLILNNIINDIKTK
jgi:hypothetical protein